MKSNTPIKWAAWVLALLLVVSSCTAYLLSNLIGGDSGGGGGNVSGTADFAYSDDPYSNMLINGTTPSGDFLVVHGEKDSDGLPKKVTHFEVTKAGDVAPTIFNIANNMISQVIAPNDVVMDLEWQPSTSSVLVSLFDPNTNESLKTVVEGNGNTKVVAVETAARPARREPLAGGSRIYELPEAAEEAVPMLQADEPANKAGGMVQGTIQIFSCGQPVDRNCWVDVFNADSGEINKDTYLDTYYPQKAKSKGVYEYSLPANIQPHHEIKPSVWVEKAAKVMSYICLGVATSANATIGDANYISTVLCPSIGVTITGLGMGVSAPGAVAFTAACSATVAGLATYCQAVHAGAEGDVSVPDLVTWLNNNAVKPLDIEWDSPLYLVPVVQASPNHIKGKAVLYEKGSTLPTVSINVEDKPQISYVYPNPTYPKEGQDYTIEVCVTCVPKGTKVTIEVWGSDDYEDKKTFTINEAAAEKKLYMDVPGADKGVRDTIVVTLDAPDGTHYGMNTHLVFG